MINAEAVQRKFIEDRRLVILRFLEEEPDYRMNVSLLQDALDLMGHKVGRDVILADGSFLADIGLITVEYVGDVQLFKLTSRGADVAQGRTKVPGVKRPSPK